MLQSQEETAYSRLVSAIMQQAVDDEVRSLISHGVSDPDVQIWIKSKSFENYILQSGLAITIADARRGISENFGQRFLHNFWQKNLNSKSKRTLDHVTALNKEIDFVLSNIKNPIENVYISMHREHFYKQTMESYETGEIRDSKYVA